ncbi:CHASE3 domain-containing protein [Pseudonocardia bannensis]|uniref:HAMP domain-containing protein n=1 Tax=Pseudonocardia bannensis TaxID=630973 RepID=A0A848DN80_9PSEU|nr:CHASE3 domain-containing protein [Pseudonocardia bannensis]NMH93881.1 HAMP domain-containing protein [Pseudonocardia bannensis]
MLTIVLSLLFLILVTSGIGLVAQQEVVGANEQLVRRSLPGLVALERMKGGFLDQETAIRGFVMTGQRAFLDPYQADRAAIIDQQQALRTALAGDPAALSRLDAVDAAYVRWSTTVAEPSILARSGAASGPLELVISTEVGMRLFDELRTRTDELHATIEASVAVASAESAVLRTRMAWLLAGSIGLGLALAAATLVGLRRWVTRPLDELVAGVSAAAAGDLGRPVQVRGPAEFVAVAAAVDGMRSELSAQRSEAVATARRETRSGESERIALQLQDGVINQLFRVGTSLLSMTNRNPQLAEPLETSVHQLDGAIGAIRAVVFGLQPGGPAPPYPDLRDRVAEIVGAAEAALGSTVVVRFGGPLDDVVAPAAADEMAVALRDTLRRLAGGDPGTTVEVELIVAAGAARLRVICPDPGPAPTREAWPLLDRAERFGGSSTLKTATDGRAVLEWILPRASGPADA